VLLDGAARAPELRGVFDEALASGGDDPRLADSADSRLRAYFELAQGRAGQAAVREAASAAVSRFLADDASKLSPATQKSLFALLPGSSINLGAAGAGAFAALSEKQIEIRREIELGAASLGELGATLAELGPQLIDFADRYDALDGKLNAIQLEIDDLRVDRAELDRDLVAFNTDYQRFEATYRGFDQRVHEFDARASALDTRVAAVDTRIEALELARRRSGGG
jgi:hypothetical protein